MKTLIKSNDIVTISFARSQLQQAGIDSFVMDALQSSLGGAVGMVYQRLEVIDEDYLEALEILIEAGLKENLWRG